ncbi:hypothetical protein [uncultured Methanoregula sp.]|uniref:hypothetical protein n=1 Tax=uncultured Methanoregula sp. TaxID=1005933 RepID=UPI002AABF97F|nr:hypothetical protein [uncultured Methanoregula sp.]
MSRILPEYQWFIVMVAGVACITLLLGSPIWYLNGLLVLLYLGVLLLTRTRRDRGFYLVCAGEPLVIACGIQNLWAGVFIICTLAGIICSVLGLFESRNDKQQFGLFLVISFLIALLIQLSNHVLLPLIILGVVAAAIILIQSIRMYQFRKHYTGA